eukprot:1067371-Pelagomonas_calceolata.AAC.1
MGVVECNIEDLSATIRALEITWLSFFPCHSHLSLVPSHVLSQCWLLCVGPALPIPQPPLNAHIMQHAQISASIKTKDRVAPSSCPFPFQVTYRLKEQLIALTSSQSSFSPTATPSGHASMKQAQVWGSSSSSVMDVLIATWILNPSANKESSILGASGKRPCSGVGTPSRRGATCVCSTV